jgi:nucleoside-diphosphate-sugar epimerase
MRVLVLGATGNLGSRVLSALLARGHVTVAFVRSPSKLPPQILKELAAVECGDAKSASNIKRVVVKHSCDAIVNTAGLAAMAPWGRSDLPAIVEAVVTAAIDVGHERRHPLRVWFLSGLGLLDIPRQKSRIVD